MRSEAPLLGSAKYIYYFEGNENVSLPALLVQDTGPTDEMDSEGYYM